jgi:predicted transcriptional regulator
VYLTDEQFARLEQLSSSRLVSKSNLIRVALDDFLADQERQPSDVGVSPRDGRVRR